MSAPIGAVGVSSPNLLAHSGVVDLHLPGCRQPQQALGAGCVRQPTVGKRLVDALKLTPAQQQSFISIQRQYQNLMIQTRNDPSLSWAQKSAAIKIYRQQERKALEAVLTPSQLSVLYQWRGAHALRGNCR
jgi:hypothetical protein